jgi:hypothetical protein
MKNLRLLLAKIRVRLAQVIQRWLLGPMAGNLPSNALRSLEEVWGKDAVKPHVRSIQVLSSPTFLHYPFPDEYPPYFRRFKAFEARLAYRLSDVCVSPASGLTWLPNADYVLSESVGCVRRLMGWGNLIPQLLHTRRPTPLSDTRLVVAGAPAPFFHWLFETLPNLLTALDLEDTVQILLPMRYPSFIRQALELRLGSNFDQRVILADNPVRVPNLLLLQTEVDAGFVPPVAIELLRNAYLPNHAKLPVGHRDIYISRRYAPSRAIANETELEDTLRERGFEIVYGEKLSFAEQVQLFSQARTVVALHGAGLSNMIWAPEKLKIIEIFPNDYFNDCYARLALQLKFDYDYLLCNLLQGTSASGMISVADVVVSLPVVSSQPQDVGVLSIV